MEKILLIYWIIVKKSKKISKLSYYIKIWIKIDINQNNSEFLSTINSLIIIHHFFNYSLELNIISLIFFNFFIIFFFSKFIYAYIHNFLLFFSQIKQLSLNFLFYLIVYYFSYYYYNFCYLLLNNIYKYKIFFHFYFIILYNIKFNNYNRKSSKYFGLNE